MRPTLRIGTEMLRLLPRSESPPDAHELELKSRLRHGDPAILNELLQSYWPPLVAFAASLVDGWDLAEDIAQEAFLRLWERRSDWSPTGSVRSLLYRICRILALNEQRSVAVRVRSRPEVEMQLLSDRHAASLLARTVGPAELVQVAGSPLQLDPSLPRCEPVDILQPIRL